MVSVVCLVKGSYIASTVMLLTVLFDMRWMLVYVRMCTKQTSIDNPVMFTIVDDRRTPTTPTTTTPVTPSRNTDKSPSTPSGPQGSSTDHANMQPDGMWVLLRVVQECIT